jgi:hypothetical protein
MDGSKLLFALALLPALVAAPQVQAAMPVFPNTQISGTVFFNLGPRIDSSTLGPISLTNPAWGTVFNHIQGEPHSAVTASAQMENTNFGPLYGRSVGTLGFFFAVDGTTPQVPVKIEVAGSATASSSIGASFVVRSTWELWNEAGQVNLLASDEISTPQMSGTFSQSFGRTVELMLDVGHIYFVKMVANAEAAATNPGSTAAAFAFVDPVFRIGDGVDPSLYTFGFSNGIGNQPVPEPPAAALLVAGLLGLAWRRQASRKERRASASVS